MFAVSGKDFAFGKCSLFIFILLFGFLLISCGDSNSGTDGDADGDTDIESDVHETDSIDGDTSESEDDLTIPDGDLDQETETEPEEEQEESKTFRFAVLGDTHIIDQYYVGPEGSPLDTETIFKTEERFKQARTLINSYTKYPIELAFIAGDFIHNLPEIEGYDKDDIQTYRDNYTRYDIAKEIIDGFNMPVYPGFGNHDYRVGTISRELTNQIYKEKYGVDPYYKVDYKGWRFIHANNYLGETCNPDSELYECKIGSFGEQQLEWMHDLLKDNMPTMIFLHHPLTVTTNIEPDVEQGFHDLLKTYKDTIKLVIAGHIHMFMDFGDTYGPHHWSVGSTRYDGNAFFIFEADGETGEYSIINRDCFQILDSKTVPYDEVSDSCVYVE